MVDETGKQNPQSGCGCVTRLFWMAGGWLGMVIVASVIMTHNPGWFTWPDLVYACLAVLVCVSRAVDVFVFHGQTSDGKPATPSHVATFIVIVVLCAAAVWAGAHLLGPQIAG